MKTSERFRKHVPTLYLMRNPDAVLSLLCMMVVLATAVGETTAADNAAPEGDLYSVAAGNVDDPDIVWSKLIPVVENEITISARVRGSGRHPVEVQFSLQSLDDPEVALTAAPKEQQVQNSGYVEYEAKWKPSKTGLYNLSVHVDPQLKTNDSDRSNNTAVVTIPVTWQELHIIAWGPRRKNKWLTTAVPVGMSGNPGDPSAEEVAYWHRRGSLALGFMYNREENMVPLSEEKMTSIILEQADRFVAAGCDGLIIDETGSYATPEGLEYIRRFGVAYNKVREKHPQLRVYNWIAGPMHLQELENARQNGHILMAESYEPIHARFTPTFPRFLERRLERLATVFGSGLQPGGIIALGIGGDVGRTFAPEIESSVRLCRSLGPIAPGICWYGGPTTTAETGYEGSFDEILDKLTMKYFIQPVLSVDESDILMSNYTPSVGEEVSIQLRVHNIGGMRARAVGVRLYARDHTTNVRTLLITSTIREIGNGMVYMKDDDLTVIDHKIVDGTTYSATRVGDSMQVQLGRALVNAKWTPGQAGYYSIEMELQPSGSHTILSGFAARTVPVVGAQGD